MNFPSSLERDSTCSEQFYDAAKHFSGLAALSCLTSDSLIRSTTIRRIPLPDYKFQLEFPGSDIVFTRAQCRIIRYLKQKLKSRLCRINAQDLNTVVTIMFKSPSEGSRPEPICHRNMPRCWVTSQNHEEDPHNLALSRNCGSKAIPLKACHGTVSRR